MNRLAAVSLAVFLFATMAVAAGPSKYGKELTIKDNTKISDILAQPDKFNGKRVRVQGPVISVCEMKGCWIAIGGDKDFQSIRFKVDDGVIVFPLTAKGLNATAEGIVTATLMSEEEQIKQGAEMARESRTTFDPKTVKGPKTVVQIKGEGAEIQ
jgi:hypothetical protein